MIRTLSRLSICALCLAAVTTYAGGPDVAVDATKDATEAVADAKSTAAFDGHSVVSMVDADTLVAGSPDHSSTWNGRTFLFADADQKAAFDAKPKRYVSEAGPRYRSLKKGVAIGGFCSVCVVDMKMATRGKKAFSSEHDGKTYLFINADMKAKFDANPAAYTANLAAAFAEVRAAMAEAAKPAKPAAANDGSHKGSH